MPEPDVLLESSDPPPPTAVRRLRTSPTAWATLVTLALVLVTAGLWAAGRSSRVLDPMATAVLVSVVVTGYVACRPRRAVGTPARWGRVPRLLAWSLVLGWTLTCVGTVVVGERQASVDRLYGELASGSVDTVRVAGELHRPGQRVVELSWREYGIRHTAEVSQVRGPVRHSGGHVLGDDGVTGRIRGDVTTALQRYSSGVRVESVPARYPDNEVNLLGWRLTGWPLWPLAALAVLTLQVLVVSPEPWRATRWAWFWLMLLAPPLGPLAYLLLGGPTGAVRQPRPGARRFTGGWAFLVFLVLGGAAGS